MGSRKFPLLAALNGVALVGVLVWSHQRIGALESTIAGLQAALKEREAGRSDGVRPPPVDVIQPRRETENRAGSNGEKRGSVHPVATNIPRSYQLLKDLDADAADDPRPYADRLQALLADNATEEEAAIACRFIFDKAGDTRDLPDYALQSIYASQPNPDLRRVIAQVLSQRGNDALLDNQIAEAQAALKSRQPRDRLEALNQLGKIHSVHAVEAIAPMLRDSDSTVRVAALFALRDSGNQRHVGLVEPLLDDPDASVSTLARNVASALNNLSATARTSYSRADIEAELPPIANP